MLSFTSEWQCATSEDEGFARAQLRMQPHKNVFTGGAREAAALLAAKLGVPHKLESIVIAGTPVGTESFMALVMLKRAGANRRRHRESHGAANVQASAVAAQGWWPQGASHFASDAACCAAVRPGVFASLQSTLLLMSAAVRVQRVHLLCRVLAAPFEHLLHTCVHILCATFVHYL